MARPNLQNISAVMTAAEFLSLKDYWYAFVSAILGCLGGITWAERQAKYERLRKNRVARDALIQAIELIVQLANQASSQFRSGYPNFPLEIQRAATLCNQIAEFNDKNLRGEIEGLLYQCSHYNAKLTVVNTAYMTSLVTNTSPAILAGYSGMMIQHLSQIIGLAQAAVDGLKKETF